MENITKICGTPRMMRDLLDRIESYLSARPEEIDTVVLLFPENKIDPRKASLLFAGDFKKVGAIQVARLCEGDSNVLSSFTECFPMDIGKQHVAIYCGETTFMHHYIGIIPMEGDITWFRIYTDGDMIDAFRIQEDRDLGYVSIEAIPKGYPINLKSEMEKHS